MSKTSYKQSIKYINISYKQSIINSGTYLGDLTFIEDGNPDWINGNMINWEKRKLQYTILSKIDQYQRTAFNFRRVVDIQKLFTIASVFSDKELFDRSLELEPRNALKSQIQ